MEVPAACSINNMGIWGRMEHVENVTMERSVQYSSGIVMEWDGRLRVDSVLSTRSRKATG